MGCCAIACCCDNADSRMDQDAQKTEATPFGKTGIKGEATKNSYIEKYNLHSDKCIQGQATTDDELCLFLQENIELQGLECLIVISAKPAHGYRLASEEATSTGIMILGQLVQSNKDSLRIFHLNGQNLDWKEGTILGQDLMACTRLELIDLYDCMISNDECIKIFEAIKKIPSLVEINFARNDINAETRDQVQQELEEVNKWRQGDVA
eukprot:440341_1